MLFPLISFAKKRIEKVAFSNEITFSYFTEIEMMKWNLQGNSVRRENEMQWVLF